MKKRSKKFIWVAGVDEAGRGPLAGPVAVGVAIVPHDFDWKLIPGVGDSKKVSPKNREAIFRRAQELKKAGDINFHVALVSPHVIDRINISRAVEYGIRLCFKKLSPNPKQTSVKLDGLIRAPAEFTEQETIIHGDAKEKVIGLASILAKVTRDKYMARVHVRCPAYGFAVHKGYGTALHRARVTQHGLSPIHRITFCKKMSGT